MRHILIAAWIGCLAIGSQAQAGDHTVDHAVVIELYTSQGCSSCPPADALFEKLAKRDDVIPLALHVDYWDYIGWADSFADPAFTRRQRAYARAAGHRMVYTPQMIVDGQDHVVGFKPMQVAELIMKHSAAPVPVTLGLTRQGDTVTISAPATPGLPADLQVQLVRYSPRETVDIGRGENAGKSITYANIVTEWQLLGSWNPGEPLNMQASVAGDSPIVVILQKPGHHEIVAAARLR